MKCFQIITLLALVASISALDKCTSDNCDRELECVCSSRASPIDKTETPQFVLLTIDDAINEVNYANYYKTLFEGRKNPDESPISATFFVPHEYTDYSVVNKLYNNGFEIGTNSISKGPADYWAKATLDTLIEEFKGHKQIITKFANIPEEHVIGARTPQFQLQGDNSMQAFTEAGLKYDGSWTALSTSKWFPYTLEFKSDQRCLIGKCPESSFPRFWISPINNINGNDSRECNVLFACDVDGTAEEMKDWLVKQFDATYKNSRSPFKLLINSAWFQLFEHSYEGLTLFIDYLATLEDVFIVSESQAIEWMKDPVPSTDYHVPVESRNAECEKIACELNKGNEIRHMTICTDCPNVYPWLGNPEGN